MRAAPGCPASRLTRLPLPRRAVAPRQAREQGVEFSRLRDIGGDRNNIRAELFLSVADGPRAAPGHDDLGALLDELSCGCEADPARYPTGILDRDVPRSDLNSLSNEELTNLTLAGSTSARRVVAGKRAPRAA
jgi:hypothetical protein